MADFEFQSKKIIWKDWLMNVVGFSGLIGIGFFVFWITGSNQKLFFHYAIGAPSFISLIGSLVYLIDFIFNKKDDKERERQFKYLWIYVIWVSISGFLVWKFNFGKSILMFFVGYFYLIVLLILTVISVCVGASAYVWCSDKKIKLTGLFLGLVIGVGLFFLSFYVIEKIPYIGLPFEKMFDMSPDDQ